MKLMRDEMLPYFIEVAWVGSHVVGWDGMFLKLTSVLQFPFSFIYIVCVFPYLVVSMFILN